MCRGAAEAGGQWQARRSPETGRQRSVVVEGDTVATARATVAAEGAEQAGHTANASVARASAAAAGGVSTAGVVGFADTTAAAVAADDRTVAGAVASRRVGAAMRTVDGSRRVVSTRVGLGQAAAGIANTGLVLEHSVEASMWRRRGGRTCSAAAAAAAGRQLGRAAEPQAAAAADTATLAGAAGVGWVGVGTGPGRAVRAVRGTPAHL